MTPEQHKRIFGWLIAGLAIYLVINKFTEGDDEQQVSKTEEIVSSIAMNVTTKVLDKQKHSRLYSVTECEDSDSKVNSDAEKSGLAEDDKNSADTVVSDSENVGGPDKDSSVSSARQQPSSIEDCFSMPAADEN